MGFKVFNGYKEFNQFIDQGYEVFRELQDTSSKYVCLMKKNEKIIKVYIARDRNSHLRLQGGLFTKSLHLDSFT